MKRTPLIAGNWKMNLTLGQARALVSELKGSVDRYPGVGVLICPPYQLLFPMAKAVADSRIMLGGQNVHQEAGGAYTGEVSVPMLKDTGCSHVIVGHSERRQYFREGGEVLAKKLRAVVWGGLTAIYCVGETLAEREENRTKAVITKQIKEVVKEDVAPERLVIAYEPVWAIGTGRTASPHQAQEVHALIRRDLGGVYGGGAESIRILYGGSVKPGNAAELCGQEDIDGALVGGASLVSGDFLAIIGAARSQTQETGN